MRKRSRLYLTGIALAALCAGPAPGASASPAAAPASGVAVVPTPAPAAPPAPPAAPPQAPAAPPAAHPGQGTVEMSTYFVALLFKGQGASSGAAQGLAKIEQADAAYIQQVFTTGKLVVAGPFQDGGDLQGMFVLRAGSLEEARELCANDPAVKAGVLLYDLHPWRAPKALNIGLVGPVPAATQGAPASPPAAPTSK